MLALRLWISSGEEGKPPKAESKQAEQVYPMGLYVKSSQRKRREELFRLLSVLLPSPMYNSPLHLEKREKAENAFSLPSNLDSPSLQRSAMA